MAVEIGEWIGLLREQGGIYGTWFSRALGHPTTALIEYADPKIAKKILPTAIIGSIFIGASIGAIIPGRPPLLDRVQVFVIVIILWAFYGILLHGLCKMLQGEGKYPVTMFVVLQLLAAAYVVSNFLTFLFVSAGMTYPAVAFVGKGLRFEPGSCILIIQSAMLAVYLPFSIGTAHEFGIIRRLFLVCVAPICIYFLSFLVITRGGC